MKNFKKQNGITLVALVVTIIVLLILAGVSLSLVAGENGILKRATSAVDKNEIGTAREQAGLKINELMAAFYEEKYVDNTFEGNAKAYITQELAKDAIKTTDSGDYELSMADDTLTVSPSAANKRTNKCKLKATMNAEGKLTDWKYENPKKADEWIDLDKTTPETP